MTSQNIVPLIIDGAEILLPSSHRYQANVVDPNHQVAVAATPKFVIQGADKAQCLAAVESCARAFPAWSATSPTEKRTLFLRLSQLLRIRGDEIKAVVEDEIHCSPLWSHINLEDTIGIADEVAALATSEALGGSIPLMTSQSQALIYREPLGVILGIAPWNAPLILGLRAVAAPVAAGNTAILKGSELSPRTHYFIAKLFQEAGFPPGVVNFITHRPEDAVQTFETLITHDAIRKCNFTGSTAVGRSIAARAGAALKPVLLELGGKNFAIVLEDADLDKACGKILEGAFLNNGQICMSTDMVLVVKSIADELKAKLQKALPSISTEVSHVINDKSRTRLEGLVSDVKSRGGDVHRLPTTKSSFAATLVHEVSPEMGFRHLESFGPILGVRVVKDASEALQFVSESSYGLSAAIFTRNHFRALQMARQMKVGAIHINGSTVHDAPNLPHGGHGDSGFGRFGGHWGLTEFVHTKTIIINE